MKTIFDKLERNSYWQIFRLIFVVFSFYLVGDALYRWNGFSFHSSFYEFVPNVSLVTILWTIIAFIAALLVWLPFKAINWIVFRYSMNINLGHLFVFIVTAMLLGVGVWIGKIFIFQLLKATSLTKLVILSCVIIFAVFLTWKYGSKAERWVYVIQRQITLWVWVFGIWSMVSVPIVVYQTWGEQLEESETRIYAQTTVINRDKPNIILIIFDTMTSMDMSVYGYYRPTTPFINKWARNASVFTRAKSGSNWTASAIAGILTGKREWTHLRSHDYLKPDKVDTENLALLLKNNGYYNMAFIAPKIASTEALGISDDFDIAPSSSEFEIINSYFGVANVLLYRTFGDKIKLYDWILKEDFILHILLINLFRDIKITTFPPEIVFKRFFSVIDNNPAEPFFAWIHIDPPHYPYLPPEPYM